MSGDINGLPGDNTRTREATKTGSEADGPEHMKQPKQPVRFLRPEHCIKWYTQNSRSLGLQKD